jgi:ABC-type transporter Mla subunit MlaD
VAVLQRVDHWRRQLTSELAQLPDTLTQLREGVENFRRVTQRLVDATAGIEQLNEMQTGAYSEVRQRVEEANRAIRDQLTAVPGGDRMAGALEDLSETLGAMARLNPFWPRPPRRD